MWQNFPQCPKFLTLRNKVVEGNEGYVCTAVLYFRKWFLSLRLSEYFGSDTDLIYFALLLMNHRNKKNLINHYYAVGSHELGHCLACKYWIPRRTAVQPEQCGCRGGTHHNPHGDWGQYLLFLFVIREVGWGEGQISNGLLTTTRKNDMRGGKDLPKEKCTDFINLWDIWNWYNGILITKSQLET